MGRRRATHTEIARWVAEQQGIDRGWNAQAVTVSYERARGRRAVGEHADGFTVTALEDRRGAGRARSTRRSSTRAAQALAARRRAPRAHGDQAAVGALRLGRRHDPRPRRLHAEGRRRRARSALEHERLADAEEAERMKAYWRERVATLKEVLER